MRLLYVGSIQDKWNVHRKCSFCIQRKMVSIVKNLFFILSFDEYKCTCCAFVDIVYKKRDEFFIIFIYFNRVKQFQPWKSFNNFLLLEKNNLVVKNVVSYLFLEEKWLRQKTFSLFLFSLGRRSIDKISTAYSQNPTFTSTW